MSVVYTKYINSTDHTWYDSSNVLYSEAKSVSQKVVNLKLVFAKGRCYLYKNVDIDDYLLVKNAESTGSVANKNVVKKYECLRLPDIELDKLEEMKTKFIEQEQLVTEATSKLMYHMVYNPLTNEFVFSMNDVVIYEGIENQVSISSLLKSMNINYSFETKTEENANEEGTLPESEESVL